MDTLHQVMGYFHFVVHNLRAFFFFRDVGVNPFSKYYNFSVLLIFYPISSSLGASFMFAMDSGLSKEIWRPIFAACALS